MLTKEYKIYHLATKNVFGFTALMHPLINTSKSFKEYHQAEEWITNEGVSQKQYIILEVFAKK